MRQTLLFVAAIAMVSCGEGTAGSGAAPSSTVGTSKGSDIAPSADPPTMEDPSGSLPTFGDADMGPAAELVGTLVDRDGCVLLVDGPLERLVLWPPGSEFDRAAGTIAIGGSGRVLALGSPLTLAGGEIDAPASVIPQACKGTPTVLVSP